MREKRNVATAGEIRASAGILVEISAESCKKWEAILTGMRLAYILDSNENLELRRKCMYIQNN